MLGHAVISTNVGTCIYMTSVQEIDLKPAKDISAEIIHKLGRESSVSGFYDLLS
jgi:hypothetical protein